MGEAMISGREKEFLFDYLSKPSPTGFESEGQRAWARYTKTFADDVENDAYGTTWASLSGNENSPHRVMLEAHADEIGFMISHISKNGLIYVTRVGGSDPTIARAKRLRFFGDKGPVTGIFGNTAIHLRDSKDDKVPQWHDLFVDIGASSADEVSERGLRVGHVAVYADEAFELTEQRLVGRALDNRIGGFIVAEALRMLASDPRPDPAVLAVNSVQEEIGGHGARMASYRLRPSVALVVDVTHATDTPGIQSEKYGHVELGKGPSLTHGTSNHPLVVKRLMQVATAEGIEIQHEASSRYTGTDTDSIFNSRTGIPSALISVPMRYMHSPVEMVDMRDVENVSKLMASFVRSLSRDDSFQHMYV